MKVQSVIVGLGADLGLIIILHKRDTHIHDDKVMAR